MLVHNFDNNKHVKFISYTGKYPNLCLGILTLEIDGEIVRFGHDWKQFNSWQHDENYDRFWYYGGYISKLRAKKGEWRICVDEIPDQYKKYATEIDSEFNYNVEYGCCGGCI